MLTPIKQFLASPVFDDEEKTRKAKFLNLLLLYFLALIGFIILTVVINVIGTKQVVFSTVLVPFLTVLSMLVYWGFLKFILIRGYVIVSGILSLSSLWILVTIALFVNGGIQTPVFTAYFVITILASAIISLNAGLVFTILSSITSIGLYWLETQNRLPPPLFASTSILPTLVINLIILYAFFGLINIILNALNTALQQTKANEQIQQEAVSELEAIRDTLEERIIDRTQELETQKQHMQAAALVTQAISTILEEEELFQQVVDAIKESFDLYYVGLFLQDERREYAILKAGTGLQGQIMMERGHRVKIGEGMIGWSIANAKPRVAQEVDSDEIRLVTEELSETRSEAALPLLSRGRVLGALTIQDNKAGIFTASTIAALQTMADQVAIALDNARLFTEGQEALVATRRAFGEVSREAWNKYLETRDNINYLATPQVETRMQASDWTSEMNETYSIGKITQQGDDTIHIPIVLRNQVLGIVRLRKQEGTRGWSEDEVQLMDSLVDQLETALETARLYSDTQIQAERERLTHEVTDKLHRSYDMDTLMQTLLAEISNALGASSAFVQLSTDLTAPESVNSTPIPNT